MADHEPTTSTAEDVEQQTTFTVKSSADAKYVVTVSLTSTVGDLKEKLSGKDYADLPAERQRLIYSGRVLKDGDTIGSCKIRDGNTVHLVRGAESNQRQNPANQGGAAAVPGAGNVPSNIAAGTGAGNPLAQLTGARYAGFHGLPGANTFGADGGMGAPPNPDQMLRLLEDPNFAQQMNEAMNNPAVIDMLRNNPMIRNNPMARAAIDNPDLRRMMMNPDMIRMQMQMQRAMGGPGEGGASFPMPGQTDTTPSSAAEGTSTESNSSTTANVPNTTGNTTTPPPNPFAALFPGAGAGFGAAPPGATNTNNPAGSPTNPAANPFASLFGDAGGDAQNNPIAQMTQQLMRDPEAMRRMVQMMGSGTGGEGAGGATGATGEGGLGGMGGFNPWAALGGAGGFGNQEPAQPADDRPPEVRYESQLRQLNDMGFYEFERNIQALRRSGGSVQGAIEFLLQS